MLFSEYFDPVSLEKPSEDFLINPNLFCKHITINTLDNPIRDINNIQIAIIGVPEERGSSTKGCAFAPDVIRNSLYKLNCINPKLKIADLGNLKKGGKTKDTYFGLRDVILELLEHKITSIIIGGSQDITYGLVMAFEHLQQQYNLTTIDYKYDLAFESYQNVTSLNYLNSIILEGKHLFEYTNIGQQVCFIPQESNDIFENLFHEGLRLGNIRNNLKETEPYLRDSDIVSFDICSVKHADAPGQTFASPNGLTSEDACQIAKYSGSGEKNKVFGIFELNPAQDMNNTTSALAAQVIWYFLDGFNLRKNENPALNPDEFKHFIISLDETNKMVFYKSPLTYRWWCEVPVKKNKNSKIIISCSETDYLKAGNHEIPDRWIKLFKKLN
jgi:arginase family enzyme